MKNVLRFTGKFLLCGAVLLFIPVNMYLININELFAFLFSVCWIVFWAFIIREKKKALNVIMGIWAVVLVVLMFAATELNAYWNTQIRRIGGFRDSLEGNTVLTRSQALEDYDFAMKYLNRIHPLAYGGLPEDVSERAAQVRDDIKNRDGITVRELAIELEQIFSMLGDGHTHVDENIPDRHYMKYIYAHNTGGYTLAGINGISLEDLFEQCRNRLSYETVSYGMKNLKAYCSTLEGLDFIGVDINSPVTYNYVSEDGEKDDVTVTAEDFLSTAEYIDYIKETTGDDLSEKEEKDFVYYDIDEDLSLAVLTVDSCDYNSFYRKTLKEMFDEVDEKGISTVVVDLRNNGGGSSMVADEFIHYLDVPSYRTWASDVRYNFFVVPYKSSVMSNNRKGPGFSGDVYILTSVFTYSAAMDFAMLIQDNGLGTIVGEPSGNLPHSYGDVACFSLPNSGLYMQVSRKTWYRVDTSKEYLPVIPDIECDPAEALETVEEMLR